MLAEDCLLGAGKLSALDAAVIFQRACGPARAGAGAETVSDGKDGKDGMVGEGEGVLGGDCSEGDWRPKFGKMDFQSFCWAWGRLVELCK